MKVRNNLWRLKVRFVDFLVYVLRIVHKKHEFTVIGDSYRLDIVNNSDAPRLYKWSWIKGDWVMIKDYEENKYDSL